jgi:hypothetical protein
MTQEELEEGLCELVWEAHTNCFHAVVMIARQLAFAAAGPDWPTYLDQHRGRLMSEAATLISSRSGFARWRR